MIDQIFSVVGFLLAIYVLFLFPAMLFLLLLLHFRLPKDLKEELLRTPFFSQAELSRLSNFPLSLLKTLAVARAVALPSTMRTRFGPHDISIDVSPTLWLASWALILLVSAGGLICAAAAICGILLEFS